MAGENKERLILVTNDDGLYAAGLRSLLNVMEEFGRVLLISSTESMSGMSQALTIKSPLRVKLLEQTDSRTVYACSGTPADGVKIAMNKLLEREPDWVVSGINHGANSSVSVLYSGTMAAAIEGTLNGIDSVGFSLGNFSPAADFTASEHYVRMIMNMLAENRLPRGVCLNVNIPPLPLEMIKGVKVCRQSDGNWREEFDKRKDPMGRTYYWLTGSFFNHEPEASDTDEWALKNGFVSVVPVAVDMTAHTFIPTLKSKLKSEEVRQN